MKIPDAAMPHHSSGVLHHDLREGRAVILRHVRDLDRDAARDLFVYLGDIAVRVGHNCRIA